jgi:hypothetical protein
MLATFDVDIVLIFAIFRTLYSKKRGVERMIYK